MHHVDIGLYDYDRHNALYYFIVNSDEQIYLRYGGRDDTGPDTYLNEGSFALALRQGLEQHTRYQNGDLAPTKRPEPFFAEQIPMLRADIIGMGRCVECHLIDDYQLLEKEAAGTLDKVQDMFSYPDIRRIGIHLDIPKGLVLERAEGAVAVAGMQAGDRIVAMQSTRLFTFGDLQHHYDKLPRFATAVQFTVERGGDERTLRVELPKEWWWTDLYHRFLTVDPKPFFSSRSLTVEEKVALKLEPDGLASVVQEVETEAKVYMLHELEPGDIIYEVDGVQVDRFTQNLDLYIKLNTESGDSFDVKLLRGGKTMELSVSTYREYFRKPEW